MARDLAYYQQLPYTHRCQLMVDDGERYWLAWIEELPGCKVEGETKAQAFLHLQELFDDYISAVLERGSGIPEPERWKGEVVQIDISKFPDPDIQRITRAPDESAGIGGVIQQQQETLATAVI